MGLFDGLLGGGDPLDIYGDLFTEKQKAALQQRQTGEGLLRLAGAFGQAAQPSRMPTSFLGTLGQAAGAMAGTGDEAMNKQLQAMQIAEKVRQSRSQRELLAKLDPLSLGLLERQMGVPPGTYGGPKGGLPAGMGVPAATPPGPPAPSSNAPPAPPSQVPTPPPPLGSGYLGPTNEELGAPPTGAPAAPGGTRPGGLPARIGMRGTGPDAVMIDLDTGQPIQSAPGGPITMPPPGALPQKQSGLLPPQDQVVGPDGQPLQGPGILPTMNASYGGAPGGGPPFQLASSTPTGGATPGAAGGASSRNDPRGVVPYIRERAAALGIDPDVAERVARSEGVGTFQSSVIQKSGRREPSWGAFQLYTGGGMGNDFQRDTGLDPSDPRNEKATIDYALKNAVNTGWTPWHGAKGAGIGARTGLPGGPSYAGGGQDTVIPSGRGIPASALTNVADTGAIPGLGTVGSGTIPGLGITPEALATLNGLMRRAGIEHSPFDSILETYYKSPGYLGEAATAQESARKRVELELGPQIKTAETLAELNAKLKLQPQLEAAIAEAKIAPNITEYERKAKIDQYSEMLKQLRGAGLEPVEVTVHFPGESAPRRITITKAQLPELASGKGIPALGIPPMSGVNLGQPVFTPGQEAEQKGAAESRVKLVQGYREQADLSADAKTTLQGISAEIGNMVHGPFAPAAQLASSYLRIVDPGFNKQVSSYEELYSNANELVRKAVRQSDPNPSFIQTQMAMDAMPVPSRSPEGLAKITNRMIGVNDHNIARAAAIPYYQANVGNGSVEGFDSWWRKSVSPYAFVFSKMSPDDQVALVSRLNTTGQGKREVEKLKTQLGFIKQYGLEQ